MKVYRKPLDKAAVKPMTSEEVIRHGRLGCRGVADGFTPGPLGLDIPESSSDDAMRVPGDSKDHGRRGTGINGLKKVRTKVRGTRVTRRI